MTKNEIKERILRSIQDNLNCNIIESLEEYIDEEFVEEVLRENSFGQKLIEEYIEQNCQNMIKDYVQQIYEEISVDDLESPF